MSNKRTILPRDREYEFSGAKLNYRVIGSGKPVVLLHGSMVADPWDGFEKFLANYYQVYLPELPGFGASETVPGRVHDTELFGEALTEFARVTGLTRAPVIAFSLGTVVAIRAAASGGIRGKLILVGMPIRLESRLLEKIMRLPLPARHALASNEITRGGLLLATLKEIIGIADKAFAPKYLKLLNSTDPRAMVDANLIEEVEKDLPWLMQQVKNQMWFVYGEHDKLRAGAEKWLKRKIHIIRGAGHDVFASRPREILRLVRLYVEPAGFWYRIWEKVR